MKEIKIIGIGYKQNSGKDCTASLINYATSKELCKSPDVYPTLHEFLYESQGFRNKMWETRRFADKLKECAATILNVPRFMFEDQAVKGQQINSKYKKIHWVDGIPLKYMTYRHFLQDMGEGMRDLIHEDIWVDALFNAWNGEKIIIPDVRYKNEAEAIRNAGGILIKVDRDVENRVGASHISEIQLDDFDWDYTIDNNGTEEELYGKVEQLVGKFKL